MTVRFEHETFSQRVVFASGQAADRVADEIARLGATAAMVLATRSRRDLAEKVSSGITAAVHHDDIAMHVPVEIAERARAVAVERGVDVLLAVGGGSTTGLAKAIALTTGLPIIAVPTTYSGSEATTVWGLTEGTVKTTGVDPRVLPRSVVYDAELTLSLPVPTSVASGLNALAHCVDSMWASRTDPIDQALAAEGIRALRLGLPAVVGDPTGLAGREQTLYGAHLSAVAFSSAGSGLHHKICHVLGGKYALPHAQTHAIVLPYVLALNGPAAPDAEHRLAAAFDSDPALDGLQDLRRRLDAPTALRDIGFRQEDIPAAAAAIRPAVPPDNPAPVTVETLERLLGAAWAGSDPRPAG